MTAIPRTILLLAIITAAIVPLPSVAADDCVAVSTATFSDNLRIIANAGRQIALGFKSPEPGNGAGFVVVITPSICSGFGVGSFEVAGARDPASFAYANVDPLLPGPTYLPLP